jgi:hypothetical protein
MRHFRRNYYGKKFNDQFITINHVNLETIQIIPKFIYTCDEKNLILN